MNSATLRLGSLLSLAAALWLPLAAQGQTITVSAAASLTDAFREIGSRFEASRPGASVRFNFAASGVLVQQIVQGAPVDVFASADQETMDRGVQARALDPASRRDFAANSLVMVAPLRGARAPAPALAGPADLARPEVRRVAIGKPATAPAGRYTRQALDAAAVWTAVEPKVVYADSVRQVLDYVARGEVDAGFVYRTDVQRMQDRVRVVSTVGGHSPITYPMAVVRDSRQPVLARAFADYLLGPEAQAILQRHGFVKP